MASYGFSRLVAIRSTTVLPPWFVVSRASSQQESIPSPIAGRFVGKVPAIAASVGGVTGCKGSTRR
jgi:hypothetical protein